MTVSEERPEVASRPLPPAAQPSAAAEPTPAKLAIPLLLMAAVPFAALTWWSVATPLIGTLLIAIGIPALRRPQRSTPTGTVEGTAS